MKGKFQFFEQIRDQKPKFKKGTSTLRIKNLFSLILHI